MAEDLLRLKATLTGRYTIERELGRGGMATVYLARDVKHDRPVALKVLRPELAASVGAERFLREIQVTAHLTHPNILPLLDSGRADDFLYYVTPYVEGESLRNRLDPARHRPSGHQAREHSPGRGPSGRGRLRHRAGAACGRRREPDGDRRDTGHRHVHEPRTGDRGPAGPPERHLQPRLCAVRDAGG